MAPDQLITVEVAYATPEAQVIIPVHVPRGTTMLQAARQSGIAERFSDLDLEAIPMGIYGKAERTPAARELQEGDRVELYRPLLVDPKEVRKKRAAAKKAEE